MTLTSEAELGAAHGISEEQVADLKEAFAMFDINGDGRSAKNRISKRRPGHFRMIEDLLRPPLYSSTVTSARSFPHTRTHFRYD